MKECVQLRVRRRAREGERSGERGRAYKRIRVEYQWKGRERGMDRADENVEVFRTIRNR